MSYGAKSKLISLSSNDRISGVPNDFICDMKERNSTQAVVRTILYQAQVPNVFQNIRSNYLQNNQLVISENGGVNITVNIPDGQYTRDALVIQLKTSLDAVLSVGNTVLVSYSDTTNKITFVFSTLPVFFNIVNSNLGDSIGFTLDSVNALSLTGDTIPNLSGITMVYLHSPEIAQSHAIDPGRVGGLINLIGAISLNDTSYGAYAYFQSADSNLSDVDYSGEPVNISVSRFILRAGDGTKLPIPLNFEIKVVLKVLLA